MTFDFRNPLNSGVVTAEVNLLNRGPMFIRLAKSAAVRLPFAVPVALGGWWLVWPAFTPAFKGRWGLGPKVEE